MVRSSIAFLVVLLGVALAGTVQFGYEGTYTTNVKGGYLFICQNGVRIQGSYNEVGLIKGGVDEDGKLNGEFFQAGSGNCIRGKFQLELTSWGVEGFFICSGAPGVITIQGVRTSSFRPTNSQCALSFDGNVDLQGNWGDSILPLDLCFRTPDDDNGDDDDDTVQGSMQVVRPDGVIRDQFVTGFWGYDGKVFTGTWYQNFNAGAILMYLRENGDIDYTWWTGLLFDNGDTYIDYAQINNPAKHGFGTIKGPRATTTFDACTTYEVLQTYVLENLPNPRDNYYHFVDQAYLPDVLRYVLPESESSAVAIRMSMILLVIAVFLF